MHIDELPRPAVGASATSGVWWGEWPSESRARINTPRPAPIYRPSVDVMMSA